MCGIAGIISLKTPSPELSQDIRSMSNAIIARGPDASGYWNSDDLGVLLAHRRLSIQDLSQAGNQPMVSPDQQLVLVFNGELYNFRDVRAELEALGHAFNSRSDTEVLLHACMEWGVENAVPRFTGMFAFALYDRSLRKITLCRDRLGEKPLFYLFENGRFSFSSELKSFNDLSFYKRSPDMAVVPEYLSFGYSRGPRTLYRNVCRLQPGRFIELSLDTGEVRTAAYWRAHDAYRSARLEPFQGDEFAAVGQLEKLLAQAIQGQLISDAPLGCFLSGGIDSSLVTAIASAQRGTPLDTFCIGFDDPNYNEAQHAREIASHLGTRHHETIITEQHCLDIVPGLADVYDEPFFDPSAIPTMLLCQIARKHVTVALSGDGGDEVFWGYERYERVARLWPRYRRLPVSSTQAVAIRKALYPLAAFFPAYRNRLNRGAYLLGSGSRLELAMRLRHLFTDVELKALCNAGLEPDEHDYPMGDNEAAVVPFDDLHDYLPNDILVKVDRAAMASSLETRIPLLDHRILEFSFGLPEQWKVKGGVMKYLLKQLLARHVPVSLTDRPKQGFAVPLARWLRTALQPWARDIVDRSSRLGSIELDHALVRKLLDEHLCSKADHSNKLWPLLMLMDFDLKGR